MKTAIAADNNAGITGGGAENVYRLLPGDMSDISAGDSEAVLVIEKRGVLAKEWKFPDECEVEPAFVEAAGGSEILAKLLRRRGLTTPADVRSFLDPNLYEASPPSELPDIPRAVSRIEQAIASQEKITIYGDYDVDGVTATAVMLTTLRELGAQVDYYIPTRSEGYGLNLKAVSVLASKHRTKLIISCDCGISNFSEINFARSLGVDTIVVDHHTMPELLPPAAAILHPKQLPEEHPLYHLPGVGVAYKLAEALLQHMGDDARIPELLDFVTLGMIADMVPLVKECRYLVQVGMPVLVGSKRPGIKALLAQIGRRDSSAREVTGPREAGGTREAPGSSGVQSASASTDLVGFGLAPRINAVGRLADANIAVKLMVTDDEAEAAELARQLEYENVRRQELCEEIFAKADQAAQKFMQSGDRAIAVYGEGWHHGVVGIVASRLVDKYHCPAFVGELDPNEGLVKGSARGVEGIDLYEVLKANEHLALKWGGHKMAAGFSVEQPKAEVFCQAIVATCNRMLADKSPIPTLAIDLQLPAEQVNADLANLLVRLAPFGMANKKPVLALRDVECVDSRALGKEAKHSRIIVADPNTAVHFECVYWNSRGRVPDNGQVIDVAFSPEINTFNGNSRLQLVINDWRDPSQPLPIQAHVAPAAVPTVDGHAIAQRLNARPTAQPTTIDARPPAQPATMDASPAARPITIDARPAAPPAAIDGRPITQLASPNGSAETTNSVHSEVPADFAPVRSAGFQPAHGAAIDAAPKPLVIKDLRTHTAPLAVIQAAQRKLGSAINLFGEGVKLEGHELVDRTTLRSTGHLLLWHYPPSIQVLQQIVSHCSATTLYLVGGAAHEHEDAASFLRRLTGLIRFAVNQREGQADPEKLAAVLSTTKMGIALGLTILKKINLIDWFAEDGIVNVDIIGQPTEKPESLPEFRQLSNCLNEVGQFRAWCHSAAVSEIQLALVPAVAHNSQPSAAARGAQSIAGQHGNPESDTSGIYPHDTTGELSSNFS